jgi:hypothetical protein
MAWFNFLLVQLLKFWTPFALIYAKCQHFKQGYFHLFQVLQNSYIVLDSAISLVVWNIIMRNKWFLHEPIVALICNVLSVTNFLNYSVYFFLHFFFQNRSSDFVSIFFLIKFQFLSSKRWIWYLSGSASTTTSTPVIISW